MVLVGNCKEIAGEQFDARPLLYSPVFLPLRRGVAGPFFRRRRLFYPLD